MDSREFLEQVREQEKDIRTLEVYKMKMESDRYRITSPLSENLGVQTSGRKETWEDVTCEIADTENKINKELKIKYKKSEKVREIINLIEDDALRAVLTYRYVLCMMWKEVEREMDYYYYSYVRGGLHDKALIEFDKAYKKSRHNQT